MDTQRQLSKVALGALAISTCIAVATARRARGAPLAARSRVAGQRGTTVKAARRLNRAAGVIAVSTLLDSGIEHYRGSFHNKAMVAPLVVSGLALAVSMHGTRDKRAAAHAVRDAVYLAAAATGAVGTGFHVYNVVKRPGGFSWQNLFYGSPLGAPAAVALSGALGYCSERLRESDRDHPSRIFGLPIERALAGLTAIGLIATSAEAGLLHFRGAYHDPFMYVPVTLPPVAAVLMTATAMAPGRRWACLARWWLRLTAFAGGAGAIFHAWGVHRNMGGWRNWRQNILNGPPVPAPPSFTGLAMAGLAALSLREDRRNG